MKRTFLRRHILIVLIVLLVSFVLISLNIRGNPDPLMLGEVAHVALAPAQRGVAMLTQSVGNVWNGYLGLVHVRRENARLLNENRRLQAALTALAERQQENIRLQRLLNLKERAQHKLMAAHVIGHGATTWSKTITLDRGRRDLIARNMVVMSHEGIVGHIIDTSHTTSQVLLITDVRSAVDGVIQRTRASGVLVGKNTSLLHMKFIPLGEDVRLGDRIISSGHGGIYPPGLLIGHINAVKADREGLFQDGEVVPSANLRRLEEVLIILNQTS